jgi:hypothetical protein
LPLAPPAVLDALLLMDDTSSHIGSSVTAKLCGTISAQHVLTLGLVGSRVDDVRLQFVHLVPA